MGLKLSLSRLLSTIFVATFSVAAAVFSVAAAVVSVAAAVFSSEIAFAEETTPTSPVVVLDMQRVLGESIAGKAARNNLEAEAKKRRLRVDDLARDVQKERESLQKQGSLLSGSALDERREAAERREKDYTRAVQDMQEELTRKNNSEVEKIVKQIDRIVEDLAKERRYSFILERDLRFVIYAKPTIDLTPEVIRRLDSLKMDL